MIEQETRLNITSSNLPAERMGPIVRSHWAVQNSLHGVMDRVFRDAAGRVRTANAPGQRHHLDTNGLQPLPKAKTRDSLCLRRKVATWDNEFLASLGAA